MSESPAFSMNAGGSLAKLSISASGAITATLDSAVGVRSVTWSIVRTDDTSLASDYTLVPSGSVGQTVAFNALLAGTAGILQAEINNGIANQTDQPSSATRAQAKFYVPTVSVLEVFTQDELGDKQEPDRTSDPNFGSILPLNALMRSIGLSGGNAVEVSTMDATVTTLTQVTPAIDSSNDFIAIVSFRSDSDGESGSTRIVGTVERTGESSAIVGVNSVLHAAAEDGTWGTAQGAPVIVDVSVTNLRIRVEGGAGDNVDWRGTLTLFPHAP